MKISFIFVLAVGSTALAEAPKPQELFIFYREGSQIVIKNCGETESIRNPSDCKQVGKENRVSPEAFKRALTSTLTVRDGDRQRIFESVVLRLKAFAEVSQNNCSSSCQSDRAKILKRIEALQAELKASGGTNMAKKIRSLSEEIVNKKILSDEISLASTRDLKPQTVYNFIKQFDGSAVDCGTDEALLAQAKKPSKAKQRDVAWSKEPRISERIKDCQKLPKSSFTHRNFKTGKDVIWHLVVRKKDPETGKVYQVWLDSHTRALWGDQLDQNYYFQDAAAACDMSRHDNEEGRRSIAGLPGITFKLPGHDDFDQAKDDGATRVLPNNNKNYWLSTPHPDVAEFAWNYHGYYGEMYLEYGPTELAVRCVAEEK